MKTTSEETQSLHPPDVVLYHADCMDGFGAAWAIWKRFPQARFVAVAHGNPPPNDLHKQHVLMVDFSYDRQTVMALANQTASLQILDHHITAKASLEDLPFAYFDMNRSGAVLAWEWAHTQPVPWLLQYVQDKDLWQWKLADSREINAALASYPFEFSIWDQLRYDILKLEGSGILRYENSLLDKILQEAIMVFFAGHFVPVVHSPILTSQIGERLSVDHPFCIIWHQKNQRRYFSLRSKEGGISVANIAAQFGGGGHTHAAGFSISVEDKNDDLLQPLSILPSQAPNFS